MKAAEREHQSRENPKTQTGPSVTAIQMKLMKVICRLENCMVQQFQ
jgi:hypothetical protein